MGILDARHLTSGSNLEADVCIVGAGAAGLTLATELAAAGRDVCLLEAGGFRPDAETQALYDMEVTGYPVRERFMSRARYFGGSCNLWAGRSMVLDESDLVSRDWVPHSGWPIPHTELAAFYPRAAALLRLPALEWFQSGAFDERMSEGETRLFDDRALRATISLWGKRPMRFGASYGRALGRSAGVRLVTNANVTKLRLDSDGRRVVGLDVRTLDSRSLNVGGRTFVLACGGLENARLLLASRDTHPAGIGNGNDLVGRFFMDHPRAVFGSVKLGQGSRLPNLSGVALAVGKAQLGVGVSARRQQKRGLLNHHATLEHRFSEYSEATYHSVVQAMKVALRRGHAGSRWDLGRRPGPIPDLIYLLTPKELMPHFAYRRYRALKDRLAIRRRGEERVVVYFCEQPPDPDSRVTLSRHRDRLGVNKLLLHWKISQEVERGVRELQGSLRRRLSETGLGVLEEGGGEILFSDASHHIGTTRMSANPRAGVVDRNSKVHGVANLYIAGSSVFPTAGHANPTLTIVALTLRLAEHIGGLDR